MKQIIFTLFVFFSVFTNSCKKEDDTQTANYNIIGSWRVSENSSTYGQQNYYVDISSDSTNANNIIIDNFFGLGLGKSIIATQSGQNLTISNAIQLGFIFNGNGIIASNNNSISLNYTVDDGNGSENITATYTKY